MLRFAFFVGTCGVILLALGIVPKPSKEDLPEFSMGSITLPEQPALISELGELIMDLPQIAEPQSESIRRPVPRRVVVEESQAVAVAEAEPVELFQPVALTQPVQVSEALEAPASGVLADIVNFDLDAAALDAQAKERLSALANKLAANPNVEVRIFGHTDLTGPEAYNEVLGQSRAEEVAAFLKANGIEAARISVVKSYGETAPMVETEERSRENRRVKVETLQRL